MMREDFHKRLESMFLSHYDEWCLHAFSYLKNIDAAEEVVQEVCASLLLKQKDVKILNLEAYIFTSIRNRSLKQIKRFHRFETFQDQDIVSSPSIDEIMVKLEETKSVRNAVSKLPTTSRTVFTLCVLEGEKYQNVADTMGISINTVKYHIKKAYKLLRETPEMVSFFRTFIGLLLFLS